MNKVYHIEFKEPIGENSHFYFGSQSAIFEDFTVEQVGISHRSLSNYHDLKFGPYENKKVIIRLGWLKRKKGDRGIKSKK